MKEVIPIRPFDAPVRLMRSVTVDGVELKIYEDDVPITVSACGMLPVHLQSSQRLLVARRRDLMRGTACFGHRFGTAHRIRASSVKPVVRHYGGDYIVLHRKKEGTVQLDIQSLQPFYVRPECSHNRHLPMTFPINKETAWLLGLYVAEGNSVDGDYASFSLGYSKKEKELAARVRSIAERLGFHTTQKVQGTSLRVYVYSAGLSRAFRKWCGTHAHSKKIPSFILRHKNLSLVRSFFDGYWAGDGCFTKGERRNGMGATASRVLAEQIQALSLRLGFFIHINPKFVKSRTIKGKLTRGGLNYFLYYSPEAVKPRTLIRQNTALVPILNVGRKT